MSDAWWDKGQQKSWQQRLFGLGWSNFTFSYWDFSAKTNTPAEVRKSPCQHSETIMLGEVVESWQ